MTDEAPMAAFSIAGNVDDALAALAAGARPVAGGTDLVVGARQGAQPLPPALVAIDRVAELGRLEADADGGLRIGSTVSHARLVTDPTVVDHHTALADGAALVGSPATRNVGTLGGNLMNASPAMDCGAPLMVLGAEVELASADRGARRVPIAELWTGPGQTSAAADELCTAVVLAAAPEQGGSAYVRLEYRRAMEIAVVGAAAAMTLDEDGSLRTLAVALTAVGPTILAVDGLEGLIGRPVDEPVLEAVAAAASAQAQPIDDLRAGSDYRRHTVGVMASRALRAAADRAEGRDIPVPVNRAIGIGAAR